ncbi:metallophosphoesterase [Streptomyces sp. DSM 41524]|uniref:Metallophosphoesterase n=1 Tax=Streptomyces asiaticus subsp. ignotus TaxID=3098222 RepID=A0ABU7PR37_9ACTN|nr:metallophosphoesterase [Streptomyces sp. DSM 41524]
MGASPHDDDTEEHGHHIGSVGHQTGDGGPPSATSRVSRRGLLGVAGAAAAGAGTYLSQQETVAASPVLWTRPEGSGMPPVSGLRLQFGADAAREVMVSWQTPVPVKRPHRAGRPGANLSEDRLRTWADWFDMTSRSSRFRPWMPAAGNHENELGNGPIGFAAYQAYFLLPGNGGDDETQGLWYAFTVGSVRVVSLAADDVALQDAGNTYVRGYSGGAQRRWLEAELTRARADRDIDWIVVVMHQVVVSTADHPGNGADLGIRQEWLPLFDKYGVDLVVCGHEHHYERSHPIRGREPNDTMTPTPAATRTDLVDTGEGTVHMVIGGGGTSIPSMDVLFDTPRCNVITGVGAPVRTAGRPRSMWRRRPRGRRCATG